MGGALLGLAVATKLTPALVLPAVVRRRPLLMIGSTLGVVGLSYLPHVVTVGTAVIGYLPGYLDEEGYGNGPRFALLTWLVPDSWAPWLALSILAVVAAAAARRTDPDQPWHSGRDRRRLGDHPDHSGLSVVRLLLVVLVALGAPVQWLAVAAAGYLAQYAHELGLSGGTARQIGYGTAVLVLLAAWVVRRRRARIAPRARSGPTPASAPGEGPHAVGERDRGAEARVPRPRGPGRPRRAGRRPARN